jgi:hypothetical protein
MKKTIATLLVALLAAACSMSFVKFDKIEENKGSIVLKIEHDSVGGIDAYTFFVRDSVGGIDKLTIDPDYAQFFAEGDTL